MAAFTKFQQFPEDLAHGVHNLGSDQISVVLCNAANAPSVSADAVLADLTTVSTANLTGATPLDVATASSGQTAGDYALVLTDLLLTCGAGGCGPFRYVVVYNNTPTSPANPLIGYIDYGGEITLADTETLLIDFAATAITL